VVINRNCGHGGGCSKKRRAEKPQDARNGVAATRSTWSTIDRRDLQFFWPDGVRHPAVAPVAAGIKIAEPS